MNTPTAWPHAGRLRRTGHSNRLCRSVCRWLGTRWSDDWTGWIAREEGIYRLGAALACPVADEACNAVSAPVWRLLTSGPRGVRLPAGEPKPITTRHPAPSGDAAPPRLAFAV
ncbi:hypothetical protein [Ottowia cancrivicina]|uniref:Uncharacterized protein n=1 Tax=Ottowia cancrivicina TaxID=3040346 RepID=A0AAW6RIB8_9BURK|nr:hypothetical protein [Ottowia sp. 10c7w1]MDG9698246.1 hypothetical protein [Ottowia sp. 10c7w1]